MAIDDKLELLGYKKVIVEEDPLTIRYIKRYNDLRDKTVVFQKSGDHYNVTFISDAKADWIPDSSLILIPPSLTYEELKAFTDKAKELEELCEVAANYD